MSLPAPRTRDEYTRELIIRTIAATDQITYFGENGVARALLSGAAILGEQIDLASVELQRRATVMNARGQSLYDAAAERGAPVLPGRRSRLCVVIEPVTSIVASLTVFSGSEDDIDVGDTSLYTVGMPIMIRNQDASIIENTTVNSIVSGVILRVNSLTDFAALSTEMAAGNDVRVIARPTIPQGTTITAPGVTFETLTAVTLGTANPIMAGETSALALADKTWCEATIVGPDGNIEPLTVTGTSPAIAGVARVFNPERGSGGASIEDDEALRYRTIQLPASGSQETPAWLESTAQGAGLGILRAIKTPSGGISQCELSVLKDTGGALSTDSLSALNTYIQARSRYPMTVVSANVVLTSVEVECSITLVPGYALAQVWRDAASRLATYLDFRVWRFGSLVDEAKLLSIVRETPGVASLETSTFVPAADIEIGAYSLPYLTRLSIRNTGVTPPVTINADLAVSFAA